MREEIAEEKELVEQASKMKQLAKEVYPFYVLRKSQSLRKKTETITDLSHQIFKLEGDPLPDQQRRMKEAMKIFLDEVASKLNYKSYQVLVFM